ncbi:hypothetical protein [Egbenema bharatensis]|uniref:hypothetical protein n=1 Tax=Egbenema bharatensis TaxID=3463334 RepID=UPI003A8B2106
MTKPAGLPNVTVQLPTITIQNPTPARPIVVDHRPASPTPAGPSIVDHRVPRPPAPISYAPQPAGVPTPPRPSVGQPSAGAPQPPNPYFLEQESNNTIADARANNNLGNLSAKAITAKGETARDDIKDIYAFSLDQQTNVSFSLAEMNQNLNLKLMDSQGRKVKELTQSGTDVKEFQKTLAPGDYFVKVFNGSHSQGSSYKLTVRDASQPTPASAA